MTSVGASELMALGRLFDAHYAQMVRLATVLLSDRHEADDIVQQAYVQLHGRPIELDDEVRAVAYLRKTVVNLARSQLRRRRTASGRFAVLGAMRGAAGVATEDAAMAHADQRMMLEALDALPPRQRECLVLRYYLDLSEGDIAATLGISAGSVKKHASRGLSALGRRVEGMR